MGKLQIEMYKFVDETCVLLQSLPGTQLLIFKPDDKKSINTATVFQEVRNDIVVKVMHGGYLQRYKFHY